MSIFLDESGNFRSERETEILMFGGEDKYNAHQAMIKAILDIDAFIEEKYPHLSEEEKNELNNQLWEVEKKKIWPNGLQ